MQRPGVGLAFPMTRANPRHSFYYLIMSFCMHADKEI